MLVQQTSTYHPSGGCLVWFGFTTSCRDTHRSIRCPHLPNFLRTEIGKSPALSDESTTQTSFEGDATGNATTLSFGEGATGALGALVCCLATLAVVGSLAAAAVHNPAGSEGSQVEGAAAGNLVVGSLAGSVGSLGFVATVGCRLSHSRVAGAGSVPRIGGLHC